MSVDVGSIATDEPARDADFGVDAPSFGFVPVEKTGSVEFLLNLEK